MLGTSTTAIPWAWLTVVVIDGLVPRHRPGPERWWRRVARAAAFAVAGAAEVGVAVATWAAVDAADLGQPTDRAFLGVVLPRPVVDAAILFVFVVALGTMVSLGLAGLAVLVLFAPLALAPRLDPGAVSIHDDADAELLGPDDQGAQNGPAPPAERFAR